MESSQTVISLLASRNFVGLYELMSVDFKAVFSESDFVSSFSSSADVVSGELTGTPTIYGDSLEWGEQLESLTLNDGTQKNYSLIFHREEEIWRLYGTEEK